MQVPQVFFGEYKKVKAESRKIVTKLLKGVSLEEIFDSIDHIESGDHPKSLFWLNRAWSLIGKQNHFPLCVMQEAIFYDPRFGLSKLKELQPSLMEFFSNRPWGTIILNASEGYHWATPSLGGSSPEPTYALEPDAACYILEGTLRFWDQFISCSKRFFWGGQNGDFFYACFPLCSFVIARCGLDTSEFPLGRMEGFPPTPAYGDLKKIILKYDLIKRMKEDATFREKARKGELFRFP
jgi:hypothetical protein